MSQALELEFSGVSARASDATYNSEFTTSQKITVPNGKHVQGVLLDIDVTPTATGTGTAYVAEVVKKVTITNENGEKVAEWDGDAGLGAVAAFSHLLFGRHQTAFSKTVVAATATSYNDWWHILGGLKGKVFTITVEFKSPAAALTGLTVTACTTTVGVVLEVGDQPAPKLTTVVQKLASAVKFDMDDSRAYMIAVDNTELSTIISGFSVAELSYTAEQVKSAENATAMKAQGIATAGSAGAVQYQLGIAGPISTNNFYMIMIARASPFALEILLSAATTIYMVRAKPVDGAVRVVRAAG